MGKAKKKNKTIICNICQSMIDPKLGNFLKCYYCENYSHLTCALQNKLVASNNFYYCAKHRSYAKSFFPEERTEEASNKTNDAGSSSGCQTISSQIDQLSQLLHSMLTVQSIPDSIISMRNSTRNEPNPVVENPHEQIPSGGSSKTIACFPRTPNFSHLPNHDPDFQRVCKKCNEAFLQADFVCRICLQCYHDVCVTPKERLNDVGGFWACGDCIVNYKEYNKQFHPNKDILEDSSKDGRSDHLYP